MSVTIERRTVDTGLIVDLGDGAKRAVAFDAEAERILVVDQRGDALGVAMASFSLDQIFGLAEAVLAGNARATTRPKAQLELAAGVIALVAALLRPDLVPAFLGGSKGAADPGPAPGSQG